MTTEVVVSSQEWQEKGQEGEGNMGKRRKDGGKSHNEWVRSEREKRREEKEEERGEWGTIGLDSILDTKPVWSQIPMMALGDGSKGNR